MNEPALIRILLIEDEPDIQVVAQLALQDIGGFFVDLAGSGSQGLTKASVDSPDLILLDVMMPGMSGPSTLKHLQADPKTAVIPVIFLTAKVQPHEVAELRPLGAWDVIAKPFDPVTLSETVRGIWKSGMRAREEAIRGEKSV